MPVYPFDPRPSSVSAAAVIDPHHQFVTDQGYELRRSMHSRPRRRFQIEYLGLQTEGMRLLRDFFQSVRLGALPFEWVHPTAYDGAIYSNTTPVWLVMPHSYVTTQWVLIQNSVPHTGLNGFWSITRAQSNAFILNGSTAGGAGSCLVSAYLPNAVGRFADGEMESPTKLIGPESVNFATGNTLGRWNMAVIVEELF